MDIEPGGINCALCLGRGAAAVYVYYDLTFDSGLRCMAMVHGACCILYIEHCPWVLVLAACFIFLCLWLYVHTRSLSIHPPVSYLQSSIDTTQGDI